MLLVMNILIMKVHCYRLAIIHSGTWYQVKKTRIVRSQKLFLKVYLQSSGLWFLNRCLIHKARI